MAVEFRTISPDQEGPVRLFTTSSGVGVREVNLHLGVVQRDDLSVRLRTCCELVNWVVVPDVVIADTDQRVVVTWGDARGLGGCRESEKSLIAESGPDTRAEAAVIHADASAAPITGIDSPYEPPENPEVHVDTSTTSAEQAADEIIDARRARGIVQ